MSISLSINFYQAIINGASHFQVGKPANGKKVVCIYSNELGMYVALEDNTILIHKQGFVCFPFQEAHFIKSIQVSSLLRGNESFIAHDWLSKEEADKNALELATACGSSARLMHARIFLGTGEEPQLLNINKESMLATITNALAEYVFCCVHTTGEKRIISEDLKDICFNTVSSFLRNVFGQGFLDSQRSAAPPENVTTVASSENVENFHSWEDHVLESHNSTENPTAAFNNMSQRSKCCGDNKSL